MFNLIFIIIFLILLKFIILYMYFNINLFFIIKFNITGFLLVMPLLKLPFQNVKN